MSIIDDTLNRLARPPEAGPAGQPADVPAPHLLLALQPPAARRRLPRSLILGLVLAGSSAAAWLVLSGTPPAPVTPRPPLAVPVPPHSLGPVAPAPAAVMPAPVVAAPGPAADPPPAAPVAEVSPVLPKTLTPGLVQGRELLETGQRDAALAAWRQGLQELPPRQRLELLAVYRDASGAFAAARRLGDLEGFFILAGEQGGSQVWRLGLLSNPGQRAAELELAARRLGRHDFHSSTPARLLAGPPERPAQVAQVAPRAAPGAPALARSEAEFDHQAGRLLQALGEHHYPEAARLAGALAEQFPQRAEVWLWSGRAALGSGDPGAAETHLARAVELAPHLAEAWLLRGIAAQEQGNDRQALTLLAEAARLKPRDADVRFNIAYSAARLGDPGRAREAYTAFLALAGREARFDAQRRHAERWLANP